MFRKVRVKRWIVPEEEREEPAMEQLGSLEDEDFLEYMKLRYFHGIITQGCKFLEQEVREKRRNFCCTAERVSLLPPPISRAKFKFIIQKFTHPSTLYTIPYPLKYLLNTFLCLEG